MDFLKEVHIRKAQNEDSENVITLLKQIAQWLKKQEINQWTYLLEGGEDEEIKQCISDGLTYIAIKESEVLATFTLLPKKNEWDRYIWGEEDSENSIYLHRLAVSPAYMNNNIGVCILDWIQTSCSQIDYLKLDCVSDNDKLNDFYKNQLFDYVGSTHGHSKYQKFIGHAKGHTVETE